MNSTVESILPGLVKPLLLNSSNLASDSSSAHCGRDALTNSYGWFVQVLLASLAFMLLIGQFKWLAGAGSACVTYIHAAHRLVLMATAEIY